MSLSISSCEKKSWERGFWVGVSRELEREREICDWEKKTFCLEKCAKLSCYRVSQFLAEKRAKTRWDLGITSGSKPTARARSVLEKKNFLFSQVPSKNARGAKFIYRPIRLCECLQFKKIKVGEQFASLVSLASRYFETFQISSMGTSGFCVGESRVPFGNCEGVQQLRFCNF